MSIREFLLDEYLDIVLLDDFDDAIIGIAEKYGEDYVVAYDKQKIIDILIDECDLSEEEAVEHCEFNIMGGYYGDRTPVFISVNEY